MPVIRSGSAPPLGKDHGKVSEEGPRRAIRLLFFSSYIRRWLHRETSLPGRPGACSVGRTALCDDDPGRPETRLQASYTCVRRAWRCVNDRLVDEKLYAASLVDYKNLKDADASEFFFFFSLVLLRD